MDNTQNGYALLAELRICLERLEPGLANPIAQENGELILMNGKARMRVAFPENEPGTHPSLLHAHITTCIGEKSFPACIVTTSAWSDNPYKPVAEKWLSLAAPPILSLLHDREVLDATRFAGCHGFIGPLGLTSFGTESGGRAELDSAAREALLRELEVLPLFMNVAELVGDDAFHTAKATFSRVDGKWRRSLEMDEHLAFIPFSLWPPFIVGSAEPVADGGRSNIIVACFAVFSAEGAYSDACEIDASLARVFSHYAELPVEDWDFSPEQLVRAGCAPEFAWAMHQFIPLAFGRQVLLETPIIFSDEYYRLARDGAYEKRPLAGEPVYGRIMLAAPGYRFSVRYGETSKIMAGMSPEIRTVDQVLRQNQSPGDFTVMPPILCEEGDMDEDVMQRVLTEIGNAYSREVAKKNRKWWQFWK